MSSARLSDFLFTGVAVLPAVLTLGGYFDIAMITFCPLLIAACLTASSASEDADGN